MSDRVMTQAEWDDSHGKLAREHCGVSLSIEVLRSAAGYYIGTCAPANAHMWDGWGDDVPMPNEPISRESAEYWSTEEEASAALASGQWTQRLHP